MGKFFMKKTTWLSLLQSGILTSVKFERQYSYSSFANRTREMFVRSYNEIFRDSRKFDGKQS